MEKITLREMLRKLYDEAEFTDVDSFEEFVALYNKEMSSVKSVGEMIEERQLGRCGFDVDKVREQEKKNAEDGIHYAEPGEDPEDYKFEDDDFSDCE